MACAHRHETSTDTWRRNFVLKACARRSLIPVSSLATRSLLCCTSTTCYCMPKRNLKMVRYLKNCASLALRFARKARQKAFCIRITYHVDTTRFDKEDNRGPGFVQQFFHFDWDSGGESPATKRRRCPSGNRIVQLRCRRWNAVVLKRTFKAGHRLCRPPMRALHFLPHSKTRIGPHSDRALPKRHNESRSNHVSVRQAVHRLLS